MAAIDNLRGDWLKQREVLDDQIGDLESGGRIGTVADDTEDARTAWLDKLRRWRTDIDTLLTRFPGTR